MMITSTTGISSSTDLLPGQTLPTTNSAVVDTLRGGSATALASSPMIAFWTLLGVAAVVAVVDWIAVARDDRRLEYLAKPGVLVALALAACACCPPPTPTSSTGSGGSWPRWSCCLAGDVLLMLPQDLFVAGLRRFLVGHVLYIVGLLQPPSPPGVPPFAFSTTGPGRGGVLVAVASARCRPSSSSGHWSATRPRALVAPVAVYLVVILTMAVLAANVGVPGGPGRVPRSSWCPTPSWPSTGSSARSPRRRGRARDLPPRPGAARPVAAQLTGGAAAPPASLAQPKSGASSRVRLSS